MQNDDALLAHLVRAYGGVPGVRPTLLFACGRPFPMARPVWPP
jgi:hypothetical protein